MKFAIQFIATFLLGVFCARANWNVHTELTVVVLPKMEAANLLPDLRDDAKIEAAFAKVEQLVEKGTARLEARLATKSDSGTKAEAKQVEELSYATEWDQPEPIGGGKVPAVAVNPSSFEKRDVGVLFSSEATASADGSVIRLKLDHSHVRFLGWKEFEAARLPDNSKVTIKEPRFAANRGTSELAIPKGSRTLLGTYAVPEKPAETEIFVLRAWTTPTAK